MPEIINYNDILEKHTKLVGENLRVCPVCGKTFTTLPGYVYKKRYRTKRTDHYRYYCSYTCFRTEDK